MSQYALLVVQPTCCESGIGAPGGVCAKCEADNRLLMDGLDDGPTNSIIRYRSPRKATKKEPLVTRPTGIPEIDGDSFQVTITMHTQDAQRILNCTSVVRELIGATLDAGNLQEEIDYTLEVHRVYRQA